MCAWSELGDPVSTNVTHERQKSIWVQTLDQILRTLHCANIGLGKDTKSISGSGAVSAILKVENSTLFWHRKKIETKWQLVTCMKENGGDLKLEKKHPSLSWHN